MVLTYNEIKVTYDYDGKIIERRATKRKTVRISEFTASVNNEYSKSTGLLYEKSKNQPIDKVIELKK